MKFEEKNKVWLSWHSIPRSQNIAKYLDIPLFEYFINDNIIKRHLYSSIWTIKFLIKNKPDIVFLHYSYLLLLFIVLYKKLSNRNLIIVADCHNKALRRKLSGIGSSLYEMIKMFSFRNTDITIITNDGLVNEILNYHTKYFILPDKIPDFQVKIDSMKNEKYSVYISSFSVDEPITEIIEVAKIIGKDVKIYWTGKNSSKNMSGTEFPDNIIFTGYLDYKDYYKLISNADSLLILTTEDDCLQCGAYEGLNAGVPMVISDNKASREYFQNSAIYTKIEPKSIVASLTEAFENSDLIKANSAKVKKERNKDYKSITDKLMDRIESLL